MSQTYGRRAVPYVPFVHNVAFAISIYSGEAARSLVMKTVLSMQFHILSRYLRNYRIVLMA